MKVRGEHYGSPETSFGFQKLPWCPNSCPFLFGSKMLNDCLCITVWGRGEKDICCGGRMRQLGFGKKNISVMLVLVIEMSLHDRQQKARLQTGCVPCRNTSVPGSTIKVFSVMKRALFEFLLARNCARSVDNTCGIPARHDGSEATFS